MHSDRAAGGRGVAWAVDRTTLARGLGVFLVTFATGAVGFLLPWLGARFTLPLLPSGIAVAALIRWRWPMLPAVLLAGAAVDLVSGSPWPVALAVGVGFALAGALTSWLLERQGFDRGFARPRDVLAFLGAAALGMAAAPSIGMLGMYLVDYHRSALLPATWLGWWSNVTAGVLLLTPPLIALNRRSFARLTASPAEGALWAALQLGLLVALVLGTPIARPPIAVLSLILTLFAAIRFGLVVAACGALSFSLTTAVSVAFSLGVFATDSTLAGKVAVWSFAGALVSICLIVTALLAERDAAAEARLRAERSYATIFEDSPQPLWVHEGPTHRFVLVNDAAVRQYGWSRAEFLARSVDVLSAGGQPVLPPADADHTVSHGAEPFETRHRTRDGRLLDVELWTCAIDLDGRPAQLVFAIDVTERRALGRAVLEAITGEQRRIGQEMHDGLGQELTGLSLSLRALATQADRAGLGMSRDIAQLADMVAGCIDSTRRIVRGLSPLSDSDGNLQSALEALAQSSSRSGTLVSFSPRLDAPLTLPLEPRAHLLRIAQEAVQNALKHSGAAHIDLELWVQPGRVTLTIEDDGRGIEPRPGTAGLGMRTMRFRATAVGGRFRIGRRSGGGTTIACEAPQPALAAAHASAT